jgi:hypothetical protein
MTEILFAAWLAVVGVLVLAPASRTIAPWGAVFLAPIAATAISTLSGLLLVAAGSYSVVLSGALTTIVAVTIVSLTAARRMVTGRWMAGSTVGAVALATVVAFVAWQVPMVRFTSDSYHYLMSALALTRSGTLEGVVDAYLLKRQLATPLLHTLGVLTGRGYVSFWTPLLGVATFGTMTWLGVTGLRLMSVPRRWRWAILVPVLALVLTTNRVLFHFFYINGHMLFAGLLLAGVGLGWFAVRTNEWTLLLPASMMFGALIPVRPEAAIGVGVFLVAFLSSSQIPVRWRWVLLAPTVVATLVWDGLVLPRLLSEPSLDLMKSPLAEIVVMMGLVALIVAGGSRSLPRFVPAAPWIVVGSLAVILGIFVVRDPQILIDTIGGMSVSLGVTGLWGVFWLVMPLLAVGAAIVGFSNDRYIFFGLASFVLIIPILAYLRGSPFHDGPGDSANRMMMHIVPLLVLAVVFAAGTLVRDLVRGDEPVRNNAPSSREKGTTRVPDAKIRQSLR